MTTTTSSHTEPHSDDTETPRGSTHTLLAGGIIAGPLFLVVSTVQALTRDGFDITKVALSSLSLGDHGWIQIANFVVTGLLCVGAGIGMRRVHPRGRARMAPPLFIVFGLGQVAAGVFTQDPAMGFPPGTVAKIWPTPASLTLLQLRVTPNGELHDGHLLALGVPPG